MVQTDLDRVLQPLDRAGGLPNAHYVSAEVWQAERQRLIFDQWAGLAFAKDVPEPGDVRPVDLAGVPLLLVNSAKSGIRVFQNTCRHRGMILVEEARNIGNGVIRCPYHSWCYGQDGRLVTTPHIGGPGQNTHPAIDRETLGLVEIASHVWRGVVFVNLSGNAGDFTEYAAGVIDRWRDFEGQGLWYAGADSAFEFDVACNWKLAVENYCESYHLPWVHPGLNSYSRLEDHYHIEAPGHFSGQGTRVYRPALGDGGQAFPNFAGLDDKWQSGAEYIALYPNVLLGVHRDHAYAMILEPHGPDRTVERTAIFYADEAAIGPAFADLRQRNTALWKGVLEEDLFVVEGMQRGRAGVHFDGGRFSPAMDGPTHLFHHWVATQMGGHGQ